VFLGLLLAGMALGAATAAIWLLAGGSMLLAVALYGLVATTFIIGAALVTFWLSERKSEASSATAEALRPAE
jgi:hypothetical protein